MRRDAGLNKSIRRYDAVHALRGTAPAKFIRPVDLELLSALAQARLGRRGYGYGLPDLLRPRGRMRSTLIRRLCETGRFLHDTAPDAQSDLVRRSGPRRAWPGGWRRTAASGWASRMTRASPLASARAWMARRSGSTPRRGRSARWRRRWTRTRCACGGQPRGRAGRGGGAGAALARHAGRA